MHWLCIHTRVSGPLPTWNDGGGGAMNEKCEVWMDEKVMDGRMDVWVFCRLNLDDFVSKLESTLVQRTGVLIVLFPTRCSSKSTCH